MNIPLKYLFNLRGYDLPIYIFPRITCDHLKARLKLVLKEFNIKVF